MLFLLLFLTFIIGLLLVGPFSSKSYTSDQLWKSYEELAQRTGLHLTERKWALFYKYLPQLKGRLGHEEIVIGINLVRNDPPIYYSYISIETIKHPHFRFSISAQTLFMKVAKEVWAEKIQTGYPIFDETFLLVATDKQVMLSLLNEDRCNTLAAFGKNLHQEIKFENGLLQYSERGTVGLKEDQDRIYAVLMFMLDLCHRLRKLEHL